jgi:hypothetical protein
MLPGEANKEMMHLQILSTAMAKQKAPDARLAKAEE